MIRIANVILGFLILVVFALASATHTRAEPELWQAIAKGDAVVLMRHALAPGTGDPAEVVIGDCSTQRNLSNEGRDQARAIGERFRENGIPVASVFTSQWCRCRETAQLLALGEPADLPPLNSFFGNRGEGPEQTEALRLWLIEDKPEGPVVLVTHQVNITGLTGVVPRSGGMVVARIGSDGRAVVLGEL